MDVLLVLLVNRLQEFRTSWEIFLVRTFNSVEACQGCSL